MKTKQFTQHGMLFKLVSKEQVFTDLSGNKIVYPAVYTTTDYDLLKVLKGINRPISPSHASKLGASVITFGNLRDVIIVKIGREYYQADGQHLLYHLKATGLPVRFKLIEAKNTKEALQIIATLNSSAKGWGIRQYINAWANFNDSYKTLEQLRKEHRFTPVQIAILLSGSNRAQVQRAIKEGKFESLDVEQATSFIRAIENFYAHLSPTGMEKYSYTTEGFIEFVRSTCDGLDNYTAVEDRFLRHAIALNKKEKHRAFARKEDVLDFFLAAYRKAIK